jgi:hypothetical protein
MAMMSDCVPELLFLKFARIPTPWESEKIAEKLGYKCMRYAKWSVVHVEEDSGAVLRRVGSQLLDQQEFPREEYGHFARVWERVQQWTVDKESLSLPAPLTQGYEQAQRLLQLGTQRRQYVREFLAEVLHHGVQTLHWDQEWLLFKQCIVTELLLGSRSVKVLELNLAPLQSVNQSVAHLKTLESVIFEIYRALGFEVEPEQPGELLDLLLGEMGLPVACEVTDEPLGTGSAVASIATPAVLIETKARTDLRFLEVVVVKDSIVLKFNDRHPAFSEGSALKAALSQPMLWESFGMACRAQLGMVEDVQSLLDGWGVHLASSARRSKL